MTDITKTHPSLKTTTSGFGWKVAIDTNIQKATIDKAVLRDAIKKVRAIYSNPKYEDCYDEIELLKKELGLEEDK